MLGWRYFGAFVEALEGFVMLNWGVWEFDIGFREDFTSKW